MLRMAKAKNKDSRSRRNSHCHVAVQPHTWCCGGSWARCCRFQCNEHITTKSCNRWCPFLLNPDVLWKRGASMTKQTLLIQVTLWKRCMAPWATSKQDMLPACHAMSPQLGSTVLPGGAQPRAGASSWRMLFVWLLVRRTAHLAQPERWKIGCSWPMYRQYFCAGTWVTILGSDMLVVRRKREGQWGAQGKVTSLQSGDQRWT